MTSASSRFFHMWQIRAASDDQGFQSRLLIPAQEYLDKTSLDNVAYGKNPNGSLSQPQTLESTLLSSFYRKDISVDLTNAAQAGLCLRCYISEPILKACKKIDSLFNSQGCFTYRDLLPFVLNDDGKRLIVLDPDNQNQLAVNPEGEAQLAAYSIFSVRVLQTFRPNLNSSMSLDNWTYLQTKQNPEIKKFLSELGFQQISDWALLNRVRKAQLERLSDRDQSLVKVFHSVYRRDRQQQPKLSVKCPNPSSKQLQEMSTCLLAESISYSSTDELLNELKQIASQLREYDIWGTREPLDIYDSTTQDYSFRSDLPYTSSRIDDLEQQELLSSLSQQLLSALTDMIEKCILDRVATLAKSKRYREFSNLFIPGLLLYYRQGMPLRKVASEIGMTSWDQARRILNPGELLNQIRTLTIQHFLKQTITKAQKMGFIQQTPDPDYINTLIEQIEAFADAEIFQEAAEEIRVGKNRSLTSVYAQQLSLKLESYQEKVTVKKEFNHA